MNDLNISRLLALAALLVAILSFVVDGPLLVIAVILICLAVLVA